MAIDGKMIGRSLLGGAGAVLGIGFLGATVSGFHSVLSTAYIALTPTLTLGAAAAAAIGVWGAAYLAEQIPSLRR